MLRARYRLTHIGGMALGLMSVVVLVWTDVEDGKGGVSAGGKSNNSILLSYTILVFEPQVLEFHREDVFLITVIFNAA